MAHSLNNPKAADFMKRVSSYSTHGSRRGFVDNGSALVPTDYNREALILQKTQLQHEITEFRAKYKISRKRKIHEIIGHHFADSKRESHRRFKNKRRYDLRELNHIKACVEQIKEIDAKIRKMPKSRQIPKSVNQCMLDILEERSPDLYRALQVEAMKKIARATAEAVRPDDLEDKKRG